jgi:hypothetical protein
MTERPPRELVDLLRAKASEAAGFTITEDFVREFVAGRLTLGTRDGELTHDRMIRWRSEVPTSYSGNYKGKKLRWFVFQGETHHVTSWKGMLLRFCELVAKDNPRTFHRALGITGWATYQFDGRPYFSQNRGELSKNGGCPEEVGDTGIFVQANLSANNIYSLCSALYHHFGYGDLECGDGFRTDLDDER